MLGALRTSPPGLCSSRGMRVEQNSCVLGRSPASLGLCPGGLRTCQTRDVTLRKAAQHRTHTAQRNVLLWAGTGSLLLSVTFQCGWPARLPAPPSSFPSPPPTQLPLASPLCEAARGPRPLPQSASRALGEHGESHLLGSSDSRAQRPRSPLVSFTVPPTSSLVFLFEGERGE